MCDRVAFAALPRKNLIMIRWNQCQSLLLLPEHAANVTSTVEMAGFLPSWPVLIKVLAQLASSGIGPKRRYIRYSSVLKPPWIFKNQPDS